MRCTVGSDFLAKSEDSETVRIWVAPESAQHRTHALDLVARSTVRCVARQQNRRSAQDCCELAG
eukprot:488023-Prymnesium_polylepis.2